MATNLDWPFYQMDVKNAFLNRDLDEKYMEMPPRIEQEGSENKVCKLRKSLYGLKQSFMAWFARVTKAVKGYGYS